MHYKISEIEKLYLNWYDKSSNLSYGDQKWIWENLPLSEEDERKLKELETNENVSVNGSVNGTYKREVKSELNWDRPKLILSLRRCTYKTPPIEVSRFLESLFSSYKSKPGHWLYVTQHWPPRAINQVLARMSKQLRRGEITPKNPAAYFTYLMKFRKKRKDFTSTNDTRKQQNQ